MQSNYPNATNFTDEAVTHTVGHGAINTGGMGTGLLNQANPMVGQTGLHTGGMGTGLHTGGMGTGLLTDPTLTNQRMVNQPLTTSTGLVGTTGTTGFTHMHGHGHRTDPVLSKTATTGTTAGTTAGTGLTHATKGTVTFRPIEGKFNKDKDLIGKMDPYCKFKIGWHRGKSTVAKSEGVNPTWGGEAITIKCKGQEFAKIKVKDHDKLRHDDNLGSAKIPLAQLYQQGSLAQWIPLTKRGDVVGEVYVEMEYAPRI